MAEDLVVLYCPSCGAPISPLVEELRPGVLYCCLDSCLGVSVVTDALTLRLVTADDIRAQPIRMQREIIEMQRMQRGLPRDVYC